MKLFPDLELVVPLDPGPWTDLYFAVTSGSYDEYALRCAIAGVEPTAGSGVFRLNRAAKDNSQ